MSTKTRLLFVDDEASIRITLPAILEMHGFAVTVAATVGEALGLINSQSFDVLLSDLNIGQPGDGFVVVSAMRRIQPEAVTIIITGYPAFETALQAIRNQVDDYITKPAEVPKLVQTIKEKIVNRQPHRSMALKRIFAVLEENQENILKQWLAEIKKSSELGSLPLSVKAWTNDFPAMLLQTIQAAESRETQLSQSAQRAAISHGEQRRNQGFSSAMLAEEIRLLLTVIGATVQENLLSVDLSHVIPDLLAVADFLGLILRESLRALSGLSEKQTA